MLGPAEVIHGPIFIGLMFNLLLYGIMITQVYLYFAAYKQDKLVVKLFVSPIFVVVDARYITSTKVLLLFLCDIINTGFDFAYLYDCFVLHFSEAAYLAKATWVFSTDPAMTGIISGFVQLFFAWRIFVLTSNVCLCGIVVLLALLGTAGGIATAAECGITSQFLEFQRFQDVVTIWLASDCLCDIVITFLLVHHLHDRRGQKTGFKRSDDLIDKIIRITVQTGLITSLCALVDLITYLSLVMLILLVIYSTRPRALQPTGIHLIFNLPLSKLYTNSLMSSLNSREPGQEPAASAPNTLSSVNTAAYKHTPVSFTRPAQDHNAVALNSRRFLDVTPHFGDDISSCLSIELLQRDSGCAMIRNLDSSGSVSGTTPDFGICNPV
ncbi:hypothetical protein ARMGADRAFT_1169928 [Armillaria gallica]|uniref:DUF6534 domain-containing protein n=1 Tax=Armillaria gallica TaxID=47427 RepID=A0A2H3DB44_ARMGA|nr:hypothetical protein ARMGADRAFT_1169928 [Armillaria gallica]